MKRIITTLLLLSFIPFVYSQDYSYSSYYLVNGMSSNPAFAGTNEFINVSANWRQQWTGFKGAPSIQTISVDGYNQRLSSGWGATLVNDMLGVTKEQEFTANYAYKIYLDKHQISFGINAGFSMIRSNFNELILDDNTDENFVLEDKHIYPTAGAGALLRNEKYFIGFSVPSLINGSWVKTKKPETLERQRSYQVFAGYLHTLENGKAIKPNLYVRLNENNAVDIAFNGMYYFNEKIGAGATYYLLNSVSFLTDINITENLKMLYSFELATSKMIKYQLGSHEMTVRYIFNNNSNYKVVNPRYF